ncbi:restriction endonuclease subunit S [Curtobacterium sp. MCBD17_028]|uniref:restriction endonuclease subunit S n=1 Tax=Curtobacterium sp. MCBD17_028 TaxID=2175670 RepID=UPI000DA94B60|nr:restriction endonuclease subunit S [Curtobacterium sp. MCBD17_028]PZE24547.1 restriction endonuclease subunit S [Curtobacterium sp. MCBD17_028]
MNPKVLGEISAFITKGATPTTYGYSWETFGVPFLRSECVSDHGLDMRQSMSISKNADNALRRSRVQDGDILMTITGNVGRVVRLHGVGAANINQHIARIRVMDRNFDPRFIYHYLSQQTMREYFGSIVTGQAYPQISLVQVRSTLVPCLPRTEQQRMADALDDADDLIATLERLIAKKQAIKQGMMQQFLTGKTRLPGFTGEWVRTAIAAQSVMKARIGWQGLKTKEYRSSGEYSLVGGTEFVDGRVDWGATPFVDKWRFDQDQHIQLRVGDVLLTKDGSIGKTAYVDFLPGPATLNSGVFVIRPVRDAYDSRFFYLMLRSRVFEDFLARLSAGSTISHLYQRDLVTLELELPPTLAEQRMVAGAMFEAENEIVVLRQRLTKARAIKRGMMQQLLTGRVRLPVEDAE